MSELKDLLTAYPAISEALQEAVRLLYGESAYKPAIFPDIIRLERVTWDPQSGALPSPAALSTCTHPSIGFPVREPLL